ncbi:MAG: hypothetical protein IIB58_12680 [Planctomycetes bacterium]|nr:hypothetical protein [Planctomycetota bacterium]
MGKDRLKDLSELLSAYLDGELEESVRAEVVAYLERDAGAVRVLNELRETRSMLQDLPRQSAPAGFSENVVSAVERQALLGGEPETAVRMSMRRRWGPIRAAASIALLVGAAGSWIYWQSDRRVFTDLALRDAAEPERITGQATDRSIGLDALASLDGTAEEPSRSDQLQAHPKANARGKEAVPIVPSAAPRNMVQSAGPAAAEQPQRSIIQQDLLVQASVDDDEEITFLGADLDPSVVLFTTSGDEQVDFGLAGHLRGSRRRAANRAGFTRRLQANEPAVLLASHDFSNEPNVLTLSFSNDAQRDEFAQKFEVYLEDNGFLSAADPRERIQVIDPLTQNVLLRGHPGLNYAEPSCEQILLNAAPEVLEELIDHYAEAIDGMEATTNIQLQMGELKVEGLKSTRRTIQALAVPELRRRVLGKDGRAKDTVPAKAADQNEQRTADQWQEHYVRLGLAARMPAAQLSDTEERAADEIGSLAQTEDESGLTAGTKHGKNPGPEVATDQSPTHEAGKEDTPTLKRKADGEERAVAAGQQDQRVSGRKSKKRRAQSAEGGRADEMKLFGGLGESPPAPGSAEGGSGGGGGGGRGGGGMLKRPQSPGPRRPTGRASNLTFVVKLQTVPIPEIGPPAPPPESDDPEE